MSELDDILAVTIVKMPRTKMQVYWGYNLKPETLINTEKEINRGLIFSFLYGNVDDVEDYSICANYQLICRPIYIGQLKPTNSETTANLISLFGDCDFIEIKDQILH